MGSLDALFGQRWDLLGYLRIFPDRAGQRAGILAAFVFQAMLADTAATIPTGAMAERWKFKAFLAYGFVASMLIYPVFGCWVWGNGWLSDLGVMFGMGNGSGGPGRLERGPHDRRGDGAGGFAGARPSDRQIQQERDGQRDPRPQRPDGRARHACSWPSAGSASTRAGPPDAMDLRIGSIATCTCSPPRAGCLASMLVMWVSYGKPDPTMTCNGLLAGAVAISASCGFVNPIGAVAIGISGGGAGGRQHPVCGKSVEDR